MDTKLSEVKNPKISLFYDNEGEPCLTLEFDTKVKENGFEVKANVQIHRIKLNNININCETKSKVYSPYMPPIMTSSKRTISFDLDCNDKYELYTIKVDEKKKKMSLSDIEKELGYKIDLQMD